MACYPMLWITYLVLFSTSATALWPQPRTVQYGDSTVWVSPSIQLSVVNRSSLLWPVWEALNGIQQLLLAPCEVVRWQAANSS
jgi:hypothetical protein